MKKIIYILLLTIFIILNTGIITKTIKQTIELKTIVYDSTYYYFSKDNLKSYIYKLNIEHPEIVYAQAVIETGHFTSNLFKNHNNLFGMTISSNRITMSNNRYLFYKKFNHWTESVIDYAIYQSTYFRKLSKEEYLNKLSKIYSYDKKYKKKLIKIIDKDN